jgi:steroid delta-isomerase-like uncharacterized protein
MLPSCSTERSRMTKDEVATKVRQTFEVWNTHDAQAQAQFYTSAATVRDSADPDNAAKGQDAIVARARMILDGFSDAELEVVSIAVDGSRACTEWRFSGTHDGLFLDVPATGRKIVTLGATVQEFEDDGKIASENAYWDAAWFLRETGVLPTAAAATP